MSQETGTHFFSLLSKTIEREKQYPSGITVSTQTPLIPRSDNLDIFKEGEQFSGISRESNAISCITPVASPHVEPVVSANCFNKAMTDCFGEEASLNPKLANVQLFSPQVVVWWAKSDFEEFDLIEIGRLPNNERLPFLKVISRGITSGTNFVELISNHPTIWGSYGFTPIEQRALLGLSRGGPTNPAGHNHITYFDEIQKTISTEVNCSAQEKLNFFAPWNLLFGDEFGTEISEVIGNIATTYLCETASKTKFASDDKKESAYQIKFNNEINLETTIGLIAEIAGKFEDLYQSVELKYEQYYKNLGSSVSKSVIREEMLDIFSDFGFDFNTSYKLVSFVLKIKPTFGQILKWTSDLEQESREENHAANLEALQDKKKRYEKIITRLDRISESNPLINALVRDTYKHPSEYPTIQNTWSLHFSAHYLIDDYQITKDAVTVSQLNLLPLIGTTETGARYKLGALSRRTVS